MLINIEISVSWIQRCSSARNLNALSSVITNSRPSPAIWLYIPRSRAFKSVDLPWKPPPTITVMPAGIPIPRIFLWCGSSNTMERLSGLLNTTAFFIGRCDTPLSLGSIEPSATKATRFLRVNSSRIYCWSSASFIVSSSSFCIFGWIWNVFSAKSGSWKNKIWLNSSAAIVLPNAGNPTSIRASIIFSVILIAVRSNISWPVRHVVTRPLFPEPFAWRYSVLLFKCFIFLSPFKFWCRRRNK